MNSVAHYQSCFNDLNGADALRPLRQQAMEHFADAGFPTTKDEEWAFTNIAPLTRTHFELAAATTAPAALDDYRYGLNGLVFVDGHFAPAHSQLNGPSAGVRVESLGDAMASNGDPVSESLGQAAATKDAAFTALNTAFLQRTVRSSICPRAPLSISPSTCCLSPPANAPTSSPIRASSWSPGPTPKQP